MQRHLLSLFSGFSACSSGDKIKRQRLSNRTDTNIGVCPAYHLHSFMTLSLVILCETLRSDCTCGGVCYHKFMNKFHSFGELYSRPSFIEGMARNLDILNTLREYNESSTERDADVDALKSDWCAVGNDIRSSVSTYEQQYS